MFQPIDAYRHLIQQSRERRQASVQKMQKLASTEVQRKIEDNDSLELKSSVFRVSQIHNDLLQQVLATSSVTPPPLS